MPTSDITFSFQSGEKISEGFFRVLKGIADRAQALIESDTAGAEPVHESRVLIKRTRALLWFARPALSQALFNRSKDQLRKAAQLLSAQRDLRVTEFTLEKIGKEAPPSDRGAVVETLKQLKEKPVQIAKEKESLDQAMRLLIQLTSAIKVPKNAKWPEVSDRVDKAHRAERKAAKKAKKTQDDLDIHAWRKKAKRLLYELELGQGNGASHKKRVLKDADELQDQLGKHQDCVVVEKRLNNAPSLTAAALRVAEILRGRKKLLRKKSVKAARRLKSEL
jgi:CHAD domain-containing protein